MTAPNRTLHNQTLIFEEIQWLDDPPPSGPLAPTGPIAVAGRPAGVAAGEPYWEFQYQLSDTRGLVVTAVVARDTQGAGSTEPVAETIDFTDLKYAIPGVGGGGLAAFDVAAGFAHPQSRFEYRTNGRRFTVSPPDPLFQRGLYLRLVNDVAGTGIQVQVALAVVFRGSANDFDPGGVPFAMDLFPQIGWNHSRPGNVSLGVSQYRGSVRVLVNNHLTAGPHAGHAPNANVASLFADSNTALSNDSRAALVGDTSVGLIRATGAFLTGKPFGWGMLFDYNRLNLTTEQEYPSVYGPTDPAGKHRKRGKVYNWPSGTPAGGGPAFNRLGFVVSKAPRQGFYDNIHLHAKMPDKADPNGVMRTQIHAPFCGHSCIHMHWRWSSIAVNGGGAPRGWQYRGWSTGSAAAAFSANDAPLIPPNQKLTFAVCNPTRTRHGDDRILPPGGAGGLDPLRKLLWYWADIFDTKDYQLLPDEQHVILEHGLGWAYRYATPDESDAVDGLTDVISDNLPWRGTPTQQQLADFFEDDVYPLWRYYDAAGIVVNQVPEGTWDKESFTGATITKMEEL